MRYLSLFEEFKLKKAKKISKHLKSGRGGAKEVIKRLDHKTNKIKPSRAKSLLGDIMKPLMKRFGLKSDVKYINCGAIGMAFSVGDDKVIKLTSSRSEATIAKNVVGKKIPNCVNYYDVVYIKKYNIYGILMDRAEILDKHTKKIVDILSASIEADGFNPWSLDELIDHVDDNEWGKVGNLPDDYLDEILSDFNEMVESLIEHGVSTMDVHSGNVGYFKGKMVHFDMMGESTDEDVSKIHTFHVY